MEQTNQSFPVTQWSLIDNLHGPDEEAKRSALDLLSRRYWPAVYSHLRRSGRGREEAAELTQAFFADVIVRRGLFGGADRESGRLRSLLCAAVRNFAIDAHRARQAPPGPRIPLDRLDREETSLGESPAASAEEAFDLAWARATLAEAMRRCEGHYRQHGKEPHWRVLDAMVVTPARASGTPPIIKDVYSRLGFDSPASASAALQVAKKRFLMLLREVVAETARPGKDLDEEFGTLMEVLGQSNLSLRRAGVLSAGSA